MPRGAILENDAADSTANPSSYFTLQCPEILVDPCDAYHYPVKSGECTVAEVDTVEAQSEAAGLFVRYLSRTVYQESETEMWTCESDAAILLDVLDDGRLTPVWRDATERTFEFIRGIRMARHGDAEIAAVQYCLNGTGGCLDNLLIHTGGKWQFLDRDDTWERVYGQLPAGYRVHKSPAMDLKRLTWEQHIAGPYDANCCPSGRLLLDLDIVAGRLSVTKARLEADLTLDRE